MLAKGGEASVYLAFHPEWKKQVVVKWMHPATATRADWRDRFARQGELLVGLEHDRIVRVYDQGEQDGRPFLVTEHIQGRTLRQYVLDTHPNAAQAVAIVADAAAALDHAHRRGVVHQDVKPDNIIIDDAGRAKLIDFGLAWFRPAWNSGTDPNGCTAGTLAYLSPEQASGGDITARTDLFALGGVLYFLLTGLPLYPGTGNADVMDRAAKCRWDRGELDTDGIPTRLRRVCEVALSADPAKRYPTGEALAAAATASLRTPWYRSPRRIGSLVLPALLLAVTLFAGRELARLVTPRETAVAGVKANLRVDVERPGFEAKPLSEVVPLKSGDRLQIRYTVPAGTHAHLVSVDGGGRLEVLQDMPARDVPQEAVWPARDRSRELTPPVGTEFLFVCGRTDRAATVAELLDLWNQETPLPTFVPAEQFLRVRTEEVTIEGSAARGFGKSFDFKERDQVKRRLEQFRDRLKAFPFLDGIAFRHQ